MVINKNNIVLIQYAIFGKKIALTKNRRFTIETLSKKETSDGMKKFMISPFSLIENIFRERKIRKHEKELQMRMAILSGGIKRMK